MIEFILLHRSFRAFDSLNVFFEVTFAMLPIYICLTLMMVSQIKTESQ